MDKTKVLVVSHPSVLAVNRALYQELSRIPKWDVQMIVPKSWRGDLIRDLEFHREDSDDKIQIEPLPVNFSGNGSLFFYRAMLALRIRRIQPDFIFLDEEPWSLSALQLAFASGGRPFSFYTKQNLVKKNPFPFRWLERVVFRKSTCAFSVEDEVSDVLRGKGYEKTTFALPHSFDPQLFRRRTESERIQFRQAYGISKDAFVFIYSGRLTEEKGIRDLMAAIQLIGEAAVSDRLHFLFIGNGPLESELRQFQARHPSFPITLLPAMPHHLIGEAVGAADVLLLPSRTTKSWKEQFGRVLVEAMASGLAVIGSDSGAIPRVIAAAGGGAHFHEGTVLELAELMRDFAEDRTRTKRYQDAGYRYCHENLTHAAQARKLHEAIQAALVIR